MSTKSAAALTLEIIGSIATVTATVGLGLFVLSLFTNDTTMFAWGAVVGTVSFITYQICEKQSDRLEHELAQRPLNFYKED